MISAKTYPGSIQVSKIHMPKHQGDREAWALAVVKEHRAVNKGRKSQDNRKGPVKKCLWGSEVHFWNEYRLLLGGIGI